MEAGPAGRAQPASPGLARLVVGRYAFSWAYLGSFVVVQVVYAQLSAQGRSELTAWASILAVVDLLILAFPGDLFGGLGRLDVAAVGHVTAAATAAACTGAIMVLRGRPARRATAR
jgi:hypothetical protein